MLKFTFKITHTGKWLLLLSLVSLALSPWLCPQDDSNPHRNPGDLGQCLETLVVIGDIGDQGWFQYPKVHTTPYLPCTCTPPTHTPVIVTRLENPAISLYS